MSITTERRQCHAHELRTVVRRSGDARYMLTLFILAVGMLLGGCASTDEPAPTINPSPPPVDLGDRIPTPAELPNDFLMQGVEELTLAEYAATWPDQVTALTQLREWGFEQAVRRVSWRNPAVPTVDADAGTTSGTLTSLTAVGVEYGSHDAAVTASEANLDALMGAEGYALQQVETEAIGDMTIAAAGTLMLNGRTFDAAHVWVIDGPVVVSYGAFAMEGDPLADVLEIATAASTRS